MGQNSSIEWTDATWNPVVGCSMCSSGCAHCYAETMSKRLAAMALADKKAGKIPDRKSHYLKVIGDNGKFNGLLEQVPEALEDPFGWRRPRRVFVNSMSDLFHENVPAEYIAKVFAVMGLASWHTFQVLTKRPDRMAAILVDPAFADLVEEASFEFSDLADDCAQRFDFVDVEARLSTDWRAQDHTTLPLKNVWLGTSVENQAAADERIPHLLKAPAAVRFLSCEPLLGPIDLRAVATSYEGTPLWTNPLTGKEEYQRDGQEFKLRTVRGIDWVIVGGESGTGARPMHPDWARSIRDQCIAAGVAFHFKQHGNWKPFCEMPESEYSQLYRPNKVAKDGQDQSVLNEVHGQKCTVETIQLQTDGGAGYGQGSMLMFNIGKHAAGRLLDGRTWDQFPEVQR